MFHASHHVAPVPASEAEVDLLMDLMSLFPFISLIHCCYSTMPFMVSQIEAEADSVEEVAKATCPLNVVLDRVVLTSTGVLIGCWQVFI